MWLVIIVALLGGWFGAWVGIVPLVLFYRRTVRRGPRAALVALTIDDGPNPRSTPALLRALGNAGVPATFFCIGRKAEAEPALMAAIRDAGHEVQNHTYSHPWNLALMRRDDIAQEITRAEAALGAQTRATRIFRPVAGITSPPVLAAARRTGHVVVTWTARALDKAAAPTSAAKALARLRRGLVPGGILLVHDDPRSPAAALIAPLAREAQARGLRFVLLSSLLDQKPSSTAGASAEKISSAEPEGAGTAASRASAAAAPSRPAR